MNDNVSCGEIRFIEDAGFWVRCLRERELHGIAAAFENIAKERDSLRARVAELEARIAEAEKQEPVAMVVHHNPPFGAVYKVEWYTKYRDLPDGTKLYAGSAPVPAAQDFSLMQGGNCCECGHELCDTCAPLHPIMPWPAAQAESKVADDVDLWKFCRDALKRGAEIESQFSQQGYETFIAEIECAAKKEEKRLRAMLAAKAKGGGKENLTTAGQEAVLVEIFHGTRDALNKLSVFPSKDKP